MNRTMYAGNRNLDPQEIPYIQTEGDEQFDFGNRGYLNQSINYDDQHAARMHQNFMSVD